MTTLLLGLCCVVLLSIVSFTVCAWTTIEVFRGTWRIFFPKIVFILHCVHMFTGFGHIHDYPKSIWLYTVFQERAVHNESAQQTYLLLLSTKHIYVIYITNTSHTSLIVFKQISFFVWAALFAGARNRHSLTYNMFQWAKPNQNHQQKVFKVHKNQTVNNNYA